MRRVPASLIILGFIVSIVGIFGIAIITGFFPMRDVLTGFYTFVFALVIISILAIIGAVFLGMFISHRVFSSRDFTAFEEEMLKMKNDIGTIKAMLEEKEED